MTADPGTGTAAVHPGTLAAFLGFLWRHRILIGSFTGIVTLATVVYVLVVPVKYTAHATLMPQTGDGPGLLSVAASLAGGGLPLGGLAALSPETALQGGILGSERLADLVAAEFDLDARYKTRNREERLRAWYSNLKTDTNQQGLLTVSFTDKEAEFAARVVGYLIENLDRYNREVRTTSSRRTRVFVEGRLEETRVRMTAIEDSLVSYQAEHQSLALSPSTEAVVTAGAEILIQRVQLEMEIQILTESLSPSAPAVRTKQAQIDALDHELAKLPELSSDMARMLRLLKVRERTYGFLSAQLEEARIEEARDTPTVTLLDPPVIPQEKSWPKRTVAVVLMFMISGLMSLVVAKVIDSIGEIRRASEIPRG